MGDLIRLDDRRSARREPVSRARCYVDLACPFSYLVAERVERTFHKVSWRLASTAMVERRDPGAKGDAHREKAERRAAELRLPLVWPESGPRDVTVAMRVAHLAVEQGRGGAFILAAGRLAFCGGYDLEDPEILAEAAAAANLPLADCLEAARDPRRDHSIEWTGRKLLALGADRVPVLRVGRSILSGERQISAYLVLGARSDRAMVKR